MKETYGNLIELAKKGQFDVIVHGCNCFCMMGGGIAKSIKEEFPEAYEADQRTDKGWSGKLGYYSFAQTGPLTVVNAYTQFRYWKEKGEDPNTPLVNYEAVRQVFKRIKEDFHGKRIGIPLIGAGLALGDWNYISQIIDEEMRGEDITLVRFA